MIRPLGAFGATWGTLGVLAVLTQAILRLGGHAVDVLSAEAITVLQGLALVGWTLYMIGTAGIIGMQRKFAPMVAGRAQHLARRPSWLRVLLAPIYCLGLFAATRRRLTISWGLVAAIAAMVWAIRLLPEPWRAIVDAGVAAGLAWGTMSVLWRAYDGLRGKDWRSHGEIPLDEWKTEGEPDGSLE